MIFYTRRSTHKRTLHIPHGHQLYAFKWRGVDLEVEGVRYIEMHRVLHTFGPPPSRGGDLNLEGGVTYVSTVPHLAGSILNTSSRCPARLHYFPEYHVSIYGQTARANFAWTHRDG